MTCKCSTTDVLDIEARSRYFPRLPLFSTTKPFDIHLNSLIYIWTMWIPQFTQFYSVQLFEFSMSVVSFIESSWYNWHVMHLDYMGMLHFRQLTQDFYFLWMLTSLVVAPFCWRFFCEVRVCLVINFMAIGNPSETRKHRWTVPMPPQPSFLPIKYSFATLSSSKASLLVNDFNRKVLFVFLLALTPHFSSRQQFIVGTGKSLGHFEQTTLVKNLKFETKRSPQKLLRAKLQKR